MLQALVSAEWMSAARDRELQRWFWDGEWTEPHSMFDGMKRFHYDTDAQGDIVPCKECAGVTHHVMGCRYLGVLR